MTEGIDVEGLQYQPNCDNPFSPEVNSETNANLKQMNSIEQIYDYDHSIKTVLKFLNKALGLYLDKISLKIARR